MKKANASVAFFINTAKFQTKLNRHLDCFLGGIGFNEFIILYHLSQSSDYKMRRVDLANSIGLTASGITRLLLPMEKIGLIKRETNPRDARVSYVVLTSSGKTKISEELERAEMLCEDIIPSKQTKKIEELSAIVIKIGKNI